ncbi:LysR family transcriptional regulator [Pseudomonas chlororaphis]|uniref:LysR family transcriptional regulator n=1 Tax=Pseudomonas chlororaphis TaxID=587753 RepID=UPI000F568B6D|nr:LysR family transcriptional regulator [Pseudomonas chlororaphis]AZC51916.1 Transcriptional regulator, LysR family [Pseudomonas chlororaphis subsp. piscium]AZC58357.1 Transcriptional regulator, LysR family [Pseudomonas chlororaphis subsp. piscium]AZC70811.1 Transcriptional regulator, LysR family [Pseudomonas chlororaphis subsp. piscium]AZC77049.1 Transcriptional regulator, LysR family [Pseudomonas chlororaphis subsp. piscium]AZC83262.1 Transcriptional regulator, LysR family [Pseudomonas chlo
MSRQFDDVLLGSIELFCMAAEIGSFTGAALAAGVTPAAVSRSVSRLEERLGVRLFVRTTRSIRLTDGGRDYHQQCRSALNQMLEAERQLTGQQLAPSGTLRISLPTTYGHLRILPLLPEFRRRYPQMRVEVNLSNRNIDFVEGGYDMAIRVRAQPDSGLVARLLEDAELVVFAAPDYLERVGTPQRLDDLAQHECIQFELPSSGRRIAWLFNGPDGPCEVLAEGAYVCSEDLLGGVTLARHGAGLFQTYRFMVERELAEGSLVEVLQPYGGRSRPFSLLYPHSRHVPLRLRAFIDFLLEKQAGWKN